MTQPEASPNPVSNRPSPALIVFLIIPLVGILVALLMIASEGSGASVRTTSSLVNRPAPDFEVMTPAGETVRLSDYAGKTIFINFWQTTCPPCVRELPALADFAEEQSENDVVVLAINIEETTRQIEDFFTRNGIQGVPTYLDQDGAVRDTYGIQVLPTTYVIAPNGQIRFMHLGELTLADLEEYVELVLTTDPSA